MAWKKNSAEAVSRFDELVAVPGAERKILFGCPVYVLAGERYATLYGDSFVLRLSPKDSAQLIAEGGKPFEPIKGRKSGQGRIVVPKAIASKTASLKGWVRRAVKYATAA
jgi:hypothetical protein